MTATHSLKMFQVLNRYFNNEADANAMVQELEGVVTDIVNDAVKDLSKKTEFELLRKELELVEARLSSKILQGQVEAKSDTNKLIIWMVATFVAGGGLMITIAKLFFK